MSFIKSIKKNSEKISLYKLNDKVLKKSFHEVDLFTECLKVCFLDLETTGTDKLNDKIIEIKFNWEKLTSSKKIMFLIPKKDTAPRVGIDNKKDILAESYLLKFSSLAAVIVIPDLLTPGTKEIIWKKPIIKADLKLKFLPISFSNLNLSLM